MKKCLNPQFDDNQRDAKKLKNWYAKTYEKLLKAKGSRDFISECLAYEIQPKFATAPKNVQTFFSKRQVKQAQKFKLQSELENKKKEIIYLTSTLSHIHARLKKFLSPTKLSFELSLLTSKIKTKLKIGTNKRNQKLENLKNKENIQKVQIANLTNIEIPSEILRILEKGLDFAYGGQPKKFQILNEMELLNSKLMKHCDKLNIDNFQRNELRAELFLKF